MGGAAEVRECLHDFECDEGVCAGGRCVECRTAAECPADRPECLEGGTCACATDEACRSGGAATPWCDRTSGRCVACREDRNCGPGGSCADDGSCRQHSSFPEDVCEPLCDRLAACSGRSTSSCSYRCSTWGKPGLLDACAACVADAPCDGLAACVGAGRPCGELDTFDLTLALTGLEAHEGRPIAMRLQAVPQHDAAVSLSEGVVTDGAFRFELPDALWEGGSYYATAWVETSEDGVCSESDPVWMRTFVALHDGDVAAWDGPWDVCSFTEHHPLEEFEPACTSLRECCQSAGMTEGDRDACLGIARRDAAAPCARELTGFVEAGTCGDFTACHRLAACCDDASFRGAPLTCQVVAAAATATACQALLDEYVAASRCEP